MSARFFQCPALITRDGHKAISAALLVALAMNPSHPTSSVCYDLVDLGDAPHNSHAEAPPATQTWTSNSVGLLQAAEEGQKEPTYVPLFLHPNSFVANVNRTALQTVFNAFTENLSDSKIQQLINNCFPADDFSQHLFTHLRVFLAGKPFLRISQTTPGDARKTWLARKVRPAVIESGGILDGETSVALKQVELAQRWFAAHFRTVCQLMWASLRFRLQLSEIKEDGTFVPKRGVKLNHEVYLALAPTEIRELFSLSKHFGRLETQFAFKTRVLKAKLDSESKREWRNYAKRLGFSKSEDSVVPFLRMRRVIHSVLWMLKFGPPIFFAHHRNEFADLADLLTQYGGKVIGPSSKMLNNLSFLGRAMRDLCLIVKDLEPFREHCEALVAHKFWKAPNTPFVGEEPK
eukprot:Blabericola_migrator_1__2958@NODE_1854_length_3659_cov_16_646158_g1185_i0_p1_GENE_NODE_1854_length_3659_cov_16_646158_g1185_i0NODE_1854_length_3659_cov_16_646158_g1185_i0_p1_ORF_typecomplete_len405_score62_96_NODE_1854_length_3659_cov_16_646158_g1185_i03831597